MSLHLVEDSISESDGTWESNENGYEVEDVSSNDERKEIQDLAKKETVSVRRWRLVVVSLLAITGGILSTFTYRLLRGEDRDDYVDAVSSNGVVRRRLGQRIHFLFAHIVVLY